MRRLGPVVQSFKRAVCDPRAKIPEGRAVAAQLVGHKNPRHAPSFHQFLQKTLCSTGIPAALHQDFQHVTVGIDGSPEPVFLAAEGDHVLVEVPFVGRCRSVAPDFGGNLSPKTLAPDPDAFIRNDHAALGQQILNIAQAQRKSMIRPDGIGNDGAREAEALQTE